MIHRFAGFAPQFEAAHFYNLVNCMGILNHRGADVEVTGVVDIFKLYRPAFPGELLQVRIESPDLGPGRAVEALCMKHDEATWLFVVNRDPEQPAKVTVGGVAIEEGEAPCLCGEKPTGLLESSTLQVAGDAVSVPPLSITRFRCGNHKA
jgi:hypothetical protein